MNKEIYKFLDGVFLFKGLRKDSLPDALSTVNFELKEYNKGDLIYSPKDRRKSIGFVYSGECEVRSLHGANDSTPINRISRPGSFGIISVFSSRDEFPTYIYAVKKSRILFISGDDVVTLTRRFPTVSLNVINFLVDRISFLNDRLATHTGSTVEDKLISYILYKRKSLGKDEFAFNKAKAASVINCGRASVYRALDKLVEDGLIQLDPHKIIISDLVGLEGVRK